MTSVRNLLDEATNGQKRKRRHETEIDVNDNQHNDNAEEPQQHDAETYAEFEEGKSQKGETVIWHEGKCLLKMEFERVIFRLSVLQN